MNAELFDIGNNFNTSTYTFTAPVKGIYLLSWQAYSNYPNQGRAQMITSVGTFTVYGNESYLQVLVLNAGQTAYMSGVNFAPSYYAAQGHNAFSGCLIREIP